MSNPGSVTRWINELRSNDPAIRNEAARQIWQRYFTQLLELARRNLSRRIRTREDEEDVVQDMYKSFCLRQQRGLFTLASRSDLWRLLVTMTLHKTRKAAARHGREARDVHRETGQSPLDESAGPHAPEWALEAMDASDPTPAEAAVLVEEFERRLRVLPEPLRRIALWKLEGFSNEEIADKQRLYCSTRTVERKLERIREAWEGV